MSQVDGVLGSFFKIALLDNFFGNKSLDLNDYYIPFLKILSSSSG